MMIKGYWQKRYDKMCDSFYLIDREERVAYTFEFTVHKVKPGIEMPSTDCDLDHGPGLMRALAEALTQAKYLPQSATDSELKATKYHLEDMRKLTLNKGT
jgi:hypothetical protein